MREPAVKAAVENQIVSQVVVQSPQISDGVASEKGLREMPYFSGQTYLLCECMRDRNGLPHLEPSNSVLPGRFIENVVRIVVKPFYIGAGKHERGVIGAADVEVGRVSAVNLMKITQREGRARSFTVVENALRSKRYAPGIVCGVLCSSR